MTSKPDSSDFTTAHVLMPGQSSSPSFVFVKRQSLRIAIVTRDNVSNLEDDWDAVGIYVLLGSSDKGLTRAYAGKGNQLKTRLGQHKTGKAWWNRAILVCDLSQNGFNSAESGWLESEIVETLMNAPEVECDNVNQPTDKSLASYELSELQPVIKTVFSLLRIMGVNPDTSDQRSIETVQETTTIDTAKNKNTETLQDLIDANLLKEGTKLYCTWINRKELGEVATVCSNGKIMVGNQLFSSPSSAAKHSRRGVANGWSYWGIKSSDGTLKSLLDLRNKLRKTVSND